MKLESMALTFVIFFMGASFVRADQTPPQKIIPSTAADDSTLRQIVSDASQLVSDGIYDGQDPNGKLCSVEFDFQIDPTGSACNGKGSLCGHLFILNSVNVSAKFQIYAPQLFDENAPGSLFLVNYLFIPPTATSDGQMNFASAQNNGGYAYLIEYKITGKSGVPSSIEGAYDFTPTPVGGQPFSPSKKIPLCSHLVKR
jgi:hypothetical protein